MNLKDLSTPFLSTEVEWRIQSAFESNGKIGAICVAYVENRAIMDRLDQVVGPQNWRNEFQIHDDGILCGLSLRCDMGDGAAEWITKWDGASRQGQEEEVRFKGGLSGSMKRAGVQWGLGRYLYDLPVSFADVREPNDRNARYRTRVKVGKGQGAKHETIRWDPPGLPKWALPVGPEELGLPVKEVQDMMKQSQSHLPPQQETSGLGWPRSERPPNNPEVEPPSNEPEVERPLGPSAPAPQANGTTDEARRADLLEWIRGSTTGDPEVDLDAFCQHTYRKPYAECAGGLLANLARRIEAGELAGFLGKSV